MENNNGKVSVSEDRVKIENAKISLKKNFQEVLDLKSQMNVISERRKDTVIREHRVILNEELARELQEQLNHIASTIIEISRSIFGDSTNMIMQLIEMSKKNAEENIEVSSTSISYDANDIDDALSRMKRVCKLYPEEEKLLKATDFKDMPKNYLSELIEIFEIQKATLKIVCSPLIAVVPDCEREER